MGLLDVTAQLTLSRLAFFVASPALLLTVLSKTPIAEVFSANLLVSTLSVVIVVALYLVVAVRLWRPSLGEAVVGSMCAAYVNAGNLGVPIAAYVLGNVSYMAPTLLLQLCVITPLAMALMDIDARGSRPKGLEIVRMVLRNPLSLGALSGVVLSLVGYYPPAAVMRPVEIVGNMAVPSMLLAFGISLRLGPRPGASGSVGRVAFLVALKLVVQPLVALGLALALGLRGTLLLAAVVTAALPTAQNVFTHANRYDKAVLLTRDAVFVSTMLSAPVIVVIALLLH